MSFHAVINEQDRLQTVNIKDGEVKNALPGVHVTPPSSTPTKGVWVLHARFDPNTRTFGLSPLPSIGHSLF